MDFIKYNLWPEIKVRLRYWWWIVKYRGKRNIPREVVFGQLAKSMSSMTENLERAMRSLPADADPEEVRQLVNLIEKAGDFEKEMEEIEK